MCKGDKSSFDWQRCHLHGGGFYSQTSSAWTACAQVKKRSKDSVNADVHWCIIHPKQLEKYPRDRPCWGAAGQQATTHCEKNLCQTRHSAAQAATQSQPLTSNSLTLPDYVLRDWSCCRATSQLTDKPYKWPKGELHPYEWIILHGFIGVNSFSTHPVDFINNEWGYILLPFYNFFYFLVVISHPPLPALFLFPISVVSCLRGLTMKTFILDLIA